MTVAADIGTFKNGAFLVTRFDEVEKARVRVRGWLLERHCAIRDLSESGKAWVLVGSPPDSYGIGIFITTDEPTLLQFGVQLELTDYQGSLDTMDAYSRKLLGMDLRLHLSGFSNIGFDVPITLDSLRLSSAIFLTDMNRQVFWDTVFRINMALQSATWVIDKALLKP